MKEEDLLYRVAKEYYEQYSEELKDMVFVFPNHRAGMFFLKHLSDIAGKSIFAPQIMTINELFASLSRRKVIDPTDLLFRLYTIRQALNLQNESFDEFIFWGKIMLSDFQEIDQHRVNAKDILSNIGDLKEIDAQFDAVINDGYSIVNQADRLSAKQFQENMAKGNNPYKEHFIQFWKSLYPTYTALRENLSKENLSYAGQLQREVVETLEQSGQSATLAEQTVKRYIFVGFNALTRVERSLMKWLKQQGKADFHWDYDSEWLRDEHNMASFYYYHNNKGDFNAEPAENNLAPRKDAKTLSNTKIPELTLIKVPSKVGQAVEVGEIIRTLSKQENKDWLETGIVLADEGMLEPLLKNIGSDLAVNVTMGYSMKLTPVYAILQKISELLSLKQETATQEWLFYHKPVLSLLSHAYFSQNEFVNEIREEMLRGNKSYISEHFFADKGIFARVFYHPQDNDDLLQNLEDLLYDLRRARQPYDEQAEFLGQALRQVRRLRTLLKEDYPTLAMDTKTLFSILLQLIESRPVPFEGEPLQGLQVMGVLESRSMVFKEVILTNCNDSIFPGSKFRNSFIPYDLRACYGLPTPQLEDAIFAYNFYRLLSHSSEVYMLMDTRSDDMNASEVSRYIQQLRYQYGLPIHEKEIVYPLNTENNRTMRIIEKDADDLWQKICFPKNNKSLISPSSLNTYTACPVHFYWQYIEGIKEPLEITETIEVNQLGTIVHNVMEYLYSRFTLPALITKEAVQKMIDEVQTTDLVKHFYIRNIRCEMDWQHFTAFLSPEWQKQLAEIQLVGTDYLMIEVAKGYVDKFLKYDYKLGEFEYIASEKRCPSSIKIHFQGKEANVPIMGFIDRIDRVNGQLRIVDYKTGAKHATIPENKQFFAHSDKSIASDHVRQTLFYSKAYLDTDRLNDCKPTIYYIKDGSVAVLEDKTYKDYAEDFELALQQVIEEILNPEQPFVSIPSTDNCRYCPFKEICE